MAFFFRFHERHGPAFDCIPATEAHCTHYKGKIPDELFEEWKQNGWCGYQDGFLWTVDPEQFLDLFDDASGRYAFLRTAFGGVIYWDGTDARYLDVLDGETSVVYQRMGMLFNDLLCDDDYLNNVLRYDLFQQALPKLGRLKKDECYGFLPPRAMGGPGTLDTLKRVKLREHLAILTQLGFE